MANEFFSTDWVIIKRRHQYKWVVKINTANSPAVVNCFPLTYGALFSGQSDKKTLRKCFVPDEMSKMRMLFLPLEWWVTICGEADQGVLIVAFYKTVVVNLPRIPVALAREKYPTLWWPILANSTVNTEILYKTWNTPDGLDLRYGIIPSTPALCPNPVRKGTRLSR